jgi:hypothetical protein
MLLVGLPYGRMAIRKRRTGFPRLVFKTKNRGTWHILERSLRKFRSSAAALIFCNKDILIGLLTETNLLTVGRVP